MGWIISRYTVKQATFYLQQKETGSKTVAKATSKYASCGVFLSVQRACQVPIVLHLTCRDILYFVFWLPYCHTLWRHQYLICIIQKSWISLEWEEIWQRGKHHSSSLLKAFQISLFFNTSIFHFIGTLSFCLKVSTDCESFIDCGRSFQSTAEANTKDPPPYALRLNTGFIKKFLVDERSDLEGL